MSKKMKIFTAGALGIMMAGLVCTNVYALDKKNENIRKIDIKKR